MPCRSGPEYGGTARQELEDKLAKRTNMLCGVMWTLNEEEREKVMSRDPSLRDWWTKHYQQDLKRRAEKAHARVRRINELRLELRQLEAAQQAQEETDAP